MLLSHAVLTGNDLHSREPLNVERTSRKFPRDDCSVLLSHIDGIHISMDLMLLNRCEVVFSIKYMKNASLPHVSPFPVTLTPPFISDCDRVCLEDDRAEVALAPISEILETSRRRDVGHSSDWSTEELQRAETLRITLLGRLGRWQETLDRLDEMTKYYGDNVDERCGDGELTKLLFVGSVYRFYWAVIHPSMMLVCVSGKRRSYC